MVEPGCWNEPFGCVIGSCDAGNPDPILAKRRVAEGVPLHAEIAAGVAIDFDEADLELDLLRLHHLHGVDRIRDRTGSAICTALSSVAASGEVPLRA